MKSTPIPNDLQNVYKFQKDDIRNKINRIRLKDDISYRNESPSNRHRGLTPIMIGILSLIHYTSRLAQLRNQIYLGLTLFECQNAFNSCGISNDTVRENIRKLWKSFKFIKRTIIHATRDNPETIYFSINDERFLCKNGTFLVGQEGERGTKLWSIGCNEYPFCTGTPRDCLMIENLEELKKTLTTGFIQKKKDEITFFIKRDEDISTISNDLLNILHHENDPPNLFNSLFEAEKYIFASKLLQAKNNATYPEEIIKIRNAVLKYYEDERAGIVDKNTPSLWENEDDDVENIDDNNIGKKKRRGRTKKKKTDDEL